MFTKYNLLNNFQYVALLSQEIILDIDDLIFDSLATTTGRHLVHHLEPLPMPSLPRVRGADIKSILMSCILCLGHFMLWDPTGGWNRREKVDHEIWIKVAKQDNAINYPCGNRFDKLVVVILVDGLSMFYPQ